MPSISQREDDIDGRLHAIIRRLDMFKMEKVKINISSTFMARARCTECGGLPNFYYCTRKPHLWKEVREQIELSGWLRTWIKRMNNNWYYELDPRDLNDIKEFSFTIDDKHYAPTYHRTFRNNTKNGLVEFVGCSCGDTVWAFTQKSAKNRPEIVNRKGRYNYPKNFEY